ncbi:MAG: ABC transporter ATP-binding protein [Spirochaetales bacterium]|nr:ABC transporter ATP-binding protein [Spirochaetales bacterium]
MKLTVEAISKNFGKNNALNNFSATFEEGHIYGLLGRNGAGKSTLLNIITDRVFASSGSVKIDGTVVTANSNQLNKIHMMSEANYYPDDKKCKDILKAIDSLTDNFNYDKAIELADKFEISLNKTTKALSTGYRTIFKIIVALSMKVNFLVLDEPTLGLDAISRDLLYIEISKYLLENEHSCIIISTHLIEEVETLVDYFYLINKGSLMFCGDKEQVLGNLLLVSGNKEKVVSSVKDAKVLNSSTQLDRLEVLVEKIEINDESLTVRHPSLQELFIKLAGVRNE